MAAGVYIVQLPSPDSAPALGRVNGVDTMVVYAQSVEDARAIVKAELGSDVNAYWDAATVTGPLAAGGDLIGYTLNVKVFNTTAVLVNEGTVACTAASSDTVDEVGALMVTALTKAGYTPAYNTSTQVLTVAAAGDTKGDYRVVATFYKTADLAKNDVPGFIGFTTHQGAGGAALSVRLGADKAAAAVSTLTLTQNAGDTNTVTIGSTVYTFQTTLTQVPGNVAIGTLATNSVDNLIAAINAGAGMGTVYAETPPHPAVTATRGAGDTLIITANAPGVAANAIATTDTLAGTSAFTSTVMASGTDGTTLPVVHAKLRSNF